MQQFSFIAAKLVCYGLTYLTCFHIKKSLVIKNTDKEEYVSVALPEENHWQINSVYIYIFTKVLQQKGYIYISLNRKKTPDIMIKAFMKLHGLIFGLDCMIIIIVINGWCSA